MADITTDMINSFFNLSQPVTKSKVAVAVKGPSPAPSDRYEPEFKLPKKDSHNSPTSPRSETSWTPRSPNGDVFLNGDEMNNLDLGPTDDIDTPDHDAPVPAAFKEEEAAHIFENYSFDHVYPDELPITKYHQEIINSIENNSVCIIHGPTGSGKTTQVPQYILDHYAKDKKYCNIIVTQPRRIAAISIAKRVCQERDCPLGSLIGYQVARDKCVSEDTRLVYVTTGVLLQKLIVTKNMNQFTHVIIDEVHERDQDTDFCLLVVRKLLRFNSRHVKIVVMSATLESDLFSRYFAMPIRGQLEGAPVLPVEGNIFPVHEFYLDDLVTLGVLPDVSLEEPQIADEAYVLAAKLLAYLDYKEKQSQGDGESSHERGSVLMFLPGLPEIKKMEEVLQDMCVSCQLWLLPLHSQITSEEQGKVFLKPKEGERKVILSTNIAESSITVPDIRYVIDFCLVKCLICDPETNFQCLRVHWASRSSCTQRKGRAGRVAAGVCYRMVTSQFYCECLLDYGIPEMQRCPLEQIVLQVKLLDLGEPKAILGLALQPPDVDDIERTVLLLKQVGALSTKMKGRFINPYDGDLTFIGKVLGILPVDIRIGKLMILGYVFGCLEECIVIGAALSLRSIFSKLFKGELQTYRWKMSWADSSFSDCIASLMAFREWSQLKETRGFHRNRGEKTWCKQNGIQMGRIREVDELVKDLTERLKNLNVRISCPLHRKNSNSPEDVLILKLVIAGAFYPNYFVCGDIDEAEANKVMSGHDPFSTVMVRGMPPYGAQYKSNIARLFRDCGRGKALYFEESKAYIEFERPSSTQGTATTTILPSVYVAIKMRHLRMPLNLYISDAKNQRIGNKLNELRANENTNRLRTNRVAASLSPTATGVNSSKLPGQISLPQKGYIEIFVVQVIDAGHFWAQYADRESAARLQSLCEVINRNPGREFEEVHARDVFIGYLCLGLFVEDEQFYRAKVISMEQVPGPERGQRQLMIELIFMDFGNTSVVPVGNLKRIPEALLQLPYQAFECELCEIQPAYLSDCPTGLWSDVASATFLELTCDRKLVAKVYSLLHGVLRVDLYDTNTDKDIHINQVLISKGLAQFMEEPFPSKMAHQQAESLPGDGSLDDNMDWLDNTPDMDGQDNREYLTKVSLRGPFNPLEMRFYSITSIGRLRAANVEIDSVNSVALNDQPQDPHPRILVAANIGINASGQSVIARETTLMPNIHGLLPIIALTFAPCAELRTDPEKHQYTGVLVGLGYDPKTNQPILPDHDIELTFDVEVNQEDVIKINSLRTGINLAFSNEGMAAEWGTAAVSKIQKACRKNVLDLILKRREERKPFTFRRQYRWNQIDSKDVLVPVSGDEQNETPELYQLHNGIAISGLSMENDTPARVLERREMNQKLHELAGRSSEPFPKVVLCELCQVRCRHPRAVTLHLNSPCHKEEESVLYDN